MLTTLIEELRDKGITLSTEDGKLVCSAPPDVMTPELQSRIRNSKDQLLDILATGAERSVQKYPVGISVDQEQYTLSSSQSRSAMTTLPGAVLPSAYMLTGNLDTAKLEHTLNQFVQRHAPLRSRFNLDGTPPTQTVIQFQQFSLPVTELSGNDEEKVRLRLKQLQEKKADPMNGICYYFELLRVGREKSILFASFSPLIFDGWSFDLFWQEITQVYAALEKGQPNPLPPLVHSYADCVVWLEQRIASRFTELRDFWQKQLGQRLPLDVIALPMARSINRCMSTVPLTLAENLTTSIREFANATGVTPQIVLLSAIYVWASRLRGSVGEAAVEIDKEIVLGIAVEGRPDIELESVVGPFANLMLLRHHIPSNNSFREFVVQVRDNFLAAHRHQELPVEDHVVQSRPGSTKLFQLEFSFQQTTDRQHKMGSLEIEQLELPSGTSAVDLTIWIKDWGDRMAGAIEFNIDSLDTDTISMWSDCLFEVLCNLVSKPDAPIGQVEILSDKNKQLLRQRFESENALIVDELDRILPLGVPGILPGKPGFYVADSNGYIRLECQSDTGPSNSRHHSPTNDIEYRLELMVGNLLGAKIDIQTNLFSAGLNSLLALKLIVEIKKSLSVSLNIPTLIQYPTIDSLAEFIESSPYISDAKTLVPLQPEGELPPLYCICGIHLYRSIALAMGNNQPVFALHIPDESDQLSNVDLLTTSELAFQYWQVIKVHHRGGPLSLLGFCFGGALAYEIACMAEKEGFTVSHLVMLDSALSLKLSRKYWIKMVRSLPDWVRNLFEEGRRKKLELLRISEIGDSVDRALSTRLDNYSPPSAYSGKTIVVDSGDSALYASWIKTPLLGWEDALNGTVDKITLATRHHDVLNPSNSRTIANHLRRHFQTN